MIAAVIASSFGVKGTIVGVAIGSAAATMATAFVAQSIERGHEAVKQVVVRAPETASLLRKLGGTGASGDSLSSQDASSAPTEVIGRPESDATGATGATGAAETVGMASVEGRTERLEISAAADAPETERLQATTLPAPRGGAGRLTARPGFSWRAIAATIGIVFVLALLFITAVELISGKPLADIFGNAGSGTSVGGFITPPATPTTTTPTTTSTTTSASTSVTTSTTSTTNTTSTTVPAHATSTTTVPSASTTTSTSGGVQATSTTTTLAPAP